MNQNGRIRLLFKDLREAIAGSDRDFTQTSIRKAIFLLAIPMVAEMIMESIFAIVDMFFVSKLGPDAVNTVGFTETMMTIVYSVAVGLSMATTAIIARRIGEKNKEGASVAAFQAVVAGLIFSAMIAIPGIIYAKDLLRMMGSSPLAVEENYEYTLIMLGTNSIIMMLFIINAIFRSAGDAAVSMWVLIIANSLNIIFDPCLIFGLGPFPELGVKGAAIATTIGRGTGVLIQVFLLLNGRKRVQILWRHMKIKLKVLWSLIDLSLGGIGQHIIATSSWIILVWIIGKFGAETSAGYFIAIRIIIFVILPAWGISNAAATLVGQNLGAKQPDKAEKTVWTIGFINASVMGFIGLILIIIPGTLMRIFTDDPAIVASGVECLTFLSVGFIFYSFGMVMIQSFNGAGDTKTPTIVNLFCFWLLEIPLAYYLALHTSLGEQGVYISIIAAEATMAITTIIIFRRGKWKTREV